MLLDAATLRNRPDGLWASTDGPSGSVVQHTRRQAQRVSAHSASASRAGSVIRTPLAPLPKPKLGSRSDPVIEVVKVTCTPRRASVQRSAIV